MKSKLNHNFLSINILRIYYIMLFIFNNLSNFINEKSLSILTLLAIIDRISSELFKAKKRCKKKQKNEKTK